MKQLSARLRQSCWAELADELAVGLNPPDELKTSYRLTAQKPWTIVVQGQHAGGR